MDRGDILPLTLVHMFYRIELGRPGKSSGKNKKPDCIANAFLWWTSSPINPYTWSHSAINVQRRRLPRSSSTRPSSNWPPKPRLLSVGISSHHVRNRLPPTCAGVTLLVKSLLSWIFLKPP